MATLEYIDIPAGATRLRSPLPSEDKARPHDIRPAPKITTALPTPSPPPSPSTRPRSLSISSASPLASPTLSLIPQLLLSGALPSTAGNANAPPTASNPRRKADPGRPTLLSSRDPLSIPIMTTNFKRFVTKVGPVFWMQDRVEEIMLWKRGWKVTGTWMAVYAFLCYFPRFILLIPHVALIAIILATYPYPTTPAADPLYSASSEPKAADATSQLPPTTPPPVTEGSVDWQANIQAIQNLMGAFSDAHTLIEPYTHHLCLTPAHFSSTAISSQSHTQPRSPYTPHILTILLVTFPPLLFLISLPSFPMRTLCLIGGLAPLALTHPTVRAVLPLLWPAIASATPQIVDWLNEQWEELRTGRVGKGMQKLGLLGAKTGSDDHETGVSIAQIPARSVIQRLMDNDRLSDECWNAEMREVELWENERFGGLSITDPIVSPPSSSSPPQRGWSKLNLHPGERIAWTRGRDGWNSIAGAEGHGEVSSNLTFSLAPGWAFVDTEDWRKDLAASWIECGGDQDGWVYTNDAWLGAPPSLYTTGGGSVM
ncbi:integral peroxisomal membrane peroxin-domain-containing protein [Crucibulum laeve]|uniref:Integral peroxisomal membrane peroxin-domain-containing protein n=1 Tax=Crucibulum laeve TaxID=68775 RepID=A0A5C3LM00_9AGAR|nr:integral peroxisomal membrane peroxin-domain-containing protein [Crucibulum laeve]